VSYAKYEAQTTGRVPTHLKLAVSIQAQPNLTTHLASSSSIVPTGGAGLEEHGTVLSGSRKPLSRANCSRQIGRKSVRETITKTSLAKA
jgi:hypothetical protein